MHEYLTNRGYRASLNANVLSGIGDSLYNIVFIVYASQMPFRTLAVSLASMAGLLPSLLAIITGYLADETRRKVRWMITARLAQAALFGLLAVAIALPHSLPLFIGLLAINIMSDLCGQYANGLGMPLLRRLIPGNELNAAMGFTTASHTTVQIIFQGLGATAIVLLHHNYSVFGLINALTFVAAAAVLLNQRRVLLAAQPPIAAVAAPRVPMRRSIPAALRFLVTQHFLFAVILIATAFNLFGASTGALMNVTLLSAPHLYWGNYGTTVALLNIATSLGLIAGSLLAHDLFAKRPLMKLMAISSALLVAASAAFIWGGSRVLILILMPAFGYMMGKINPRISAMMMRLVPEDQLAKVSGVIDMLALIGAPIGQFVFLGLANLLTPSAGWWAFGGGAAVLLAATLLVDQRVAEPALPDDDAVTAAPERVSDGD
ncbi:MFS transporter [Lacticaseibacillus absianus]|uniref:MFS transporter n=1 Tax=Lacticaseibacillus absianus TaxID=2729623 RepID=UPI0015C70041|nr:MFS transporter [Lacticaseibacillus absianus]